MGLPPMPMRLFKFSFALLLLAGLGGAYGFWHLKEWSLGAKTLPEAKVVEFPPGTGLKALAKDLAREGVVDDPRRFEFYVRFMNSYRKFQAGKYRFEGTVRPQDVAMKMVEGDVYWPVVLEFTIPEGFTLKKICDRLAANGVDHIKELTRLVHDPEFAKSLGVPAKNLEGFLYPATYTFVKKPSAPEVLQHMVETFWKKLPKDYESKAKAMGLSLYEAVNFASLIELETKMDDERPMVSEVIWRRLKKDDFLALDAAMIYGIKDYDGDIKWKHLNDKNNPYNTRVHKGLPPTPIGSPGVKSLEAVLIPTNLGNYYYVLLPGSERHHFSKTLKEHNIYVRKLVQASKRNRKNQKKSAKKTPKKPQASN